MNRFRIRSLLVALVIGGLSVLARGDDGDGSGISEPTFVRGDCNSDERVDISDPVFLMIYLFVGGESPSCLAAADANDDEAVDVSDPIYLLHALFVRGNIPPEPYPSAGPDPTPGLPCEVGTSE